MRSAEPGSTGSRSASPRRMTVDLIETIVLAAKGRYKTGLPIDDAIEHACNGRNLSAQQRETIAIRVYDVICETEQPGTLAFRALLDQIEVVTVAHLQAFTERAAEGLMMPTHANVLVVVASSKVLWAQYERLVALTGIVVPRPDDVDVHCANKARVTDSIRNAPPLERLRIANEMTHGRLGSTVRTALAAATRSELIRDSLYHVRTVIALMEPAAV